jgi:hypothetical protein
MHCLVPAREREKENKKYTFACIRPGDKKYKRADSLHWLVSRRARENRLDRANEREAKQECIPREA